MTDWAYTELKHSFDLQQFGNIKTTSTAHYLIGFLDYKYINLENRKTSVAAVTVDLIKTFDLVDHTKVIQKGLAMGLRECVVAWLADFLADRRQTVRLMGATSIFLSLKCGVLQDTKIGPMCFLIILNHALQDM